MGILSGEACLGDYMDPKSKDMDCIHSRAFNESKSLLWTIKLGVVERQSMRKSIERALHAWMALWMKSARAHHLPFGTKGYLRIYESALAR
jgi:hypothetical protein